MNFRFDGYEVLDGADGSENGVRFHFTLLNPGPVYQDSDWYIFCTDAELGAVSTQGQLLTLVTAKLNRKVKRVGFTTKLDPFIGQVVVLT